MGDRAIVCNAACPLALLNSSQMIGDMDLAGITLLSQELIQIVAETLGEVSVTLF